MNAVLKSYWPAILWAFFILVICNIKMGGVSHSPTFFEGFDKLVHCGLFFTMTVLYSAGYLRHNKKRGLSVLTAVLIILFMVAFGGAVELLQKYFFTWRGADWNDLFADAVGICMGMFSILVTSNAVKYANK